MRIHNLVLQLVTLSLIGCAKSAGAPPMEDRFYDASLANPIDLGVTAVSLRDAKRESRSAPDTVSRLGFTSRYANLSRNSRGRGPLSSAVWQVRWKAAL